MEGLVAKLGKNDPDALVRMMGSLVVSGGNRNVFEQAIGSLSVETPEKSLEQASELPEGEALAGRTGGGGIEVKRGGGSWY